jgi:omega-6 fatty acid desaturase (delta-12 desaturase)
VSHFSWKYSRRRHHSNIGNVDHDEVFIPKKKKEITAAEARGWGVIKYLQHPLGRILMITLMLLLGWSLYLICNVSGKKYLWRIYVPIGAVFLLEVFSQASSQQNEY